MKKTTSGASEKVIFSPLDMAENTLKSFKEDTEKLASLKNSIDNYRSLLQQAEEKLFSSSIRQAFERFPQMEYFRWTQYTPYFNDGAPCEFTVYADWDGLDINGRSLYDYSESASFRNDEGYHHRLSSNEEDLWAVEASMYVSDMLFSFSEESMKTMFGDHVEIVVYKDRMEVTEYEHD